MQHYKKSLLLTLYIDRFAIACWCVSLFLIPCFARWYDMYSNKESIFTQFVAIVYVIMVPAFLILFLLNLLLSNIRREEVFEKKNVTILRVISYCCFAISVISAVMVLWRIMAIVICFSFAFVGLLLRVLKNVFEEAVVLREENDLTV